MVLVTVLLPSGGRASEWRRAGEYPRASAGLVQRYSLSGIAQMPLPGLASLTPALSHRERGSEPGAYAGRG